MPPPRVNYKQAVRNLNEELKGAWHLDPWGWPEWRWITDGNHDKDIRAREATSETHIPSPIDIPKDGFGVRPAVVLDPFDNLVYQGIVDRYSKNLIGRLPINVYGWRLPRERPRAGEYAPNAREWDRFRDRLSIFSSLLRYGLLTDINNFFASIDMDRLVDELDPHVRVEKHKAWLTTNLQRWSQQPTRSGLPQRSTASSILAHFFLTPLDEALRDAGERLRILKLLGYREHGSAVRWMDDMWVFSSTEAPLRALQVDLIHLLRSLGLELNSGKTEVVADEELELRAKLIEHSAVDEALIDDDDPSKLDALLDRLLTDPPNAARTSFRFAASRMRNHKLFNRVDDIVEECIEMPHVADEVGHLIRTSSQWSKYADWFPHYCTEIWGDFHWSCARMASMFPDKYRSAPKVVKDLVREWILTARDLPRIAVGVRKLSSWDRSAALQAIGGRIRDEPVPAIRRLLCLGWVRVKGDRATPRAVLKGGGSHTDSLVLRHLEERSFSTPKLATEFLW